MSGFILRHRVTVFLALVLAVASTAAVFSVMAYAASRQTGAASLSNVKISKFDAADTNAFNPVCGPSGWSDIPGMTKTFKLAGTASRPVTVTYSGNAVMQAPGTGADLRLLVDGTQEGAGTWEVGSGGGPENTPMSFTALTPPLTPGNHTVDIQFQPTANFCILGPQTLVILHD
jgi:hypothetical protein